MIARHPYLDNTSPIAFAHRGGTSAAPENTLRSFDDAVTLGYRYVETDVHATRDGKLVAFHDNDLQRTCGKPWKIEETEEQLVSGLQLKQHELDVIASLSNGKRALHWLSTRLLLRTMLNTTEYIDCQMDDHGKPYLVNSDTHISLSHSYDYAAVIISKDKKVIVHCRSGARSANAIGFLEQQHGYTNLYNLSGGILAWAAEIDPTMDSY